MQDAIEMIGAVILGILFIAINVLFAALPIVAAIAIYHWIF